MKRLYTLLGGIVIAIVVLGAGYYFMTNRGNLSGGVYKDAGDDLSDYSAVFVEGGGIYFGKITKMAPGEMILEEVYNYGIVPTEDADAAAAAEDQETRPTLFDASKVGIAPANRYIINREKVILWYSLKNGSDVVKTIDEYKKGN